MKINVIGTSGSGKSTFSMILAQKLQVPYIQMDALMWQKNWQETPDPEFFKKIKQAIQPSSWVLDGNYTRTIPIKWDHINLVIWIDPSFLRNFYQSLKRALIRSLTQQEIWEGTGNKESLKKLSYLLIQSFFGCSKHFIKTDVAMQQ